MPVTIPHPGRVAVDSSIPRSAATRWSSSPSDAATESPTSPTRPSRGGPGGAPGTVVTTDGGAFSITVLGFAVRNAGAGRPPLVSTIVTTAVTTNAAGAATRATQPLSAPYRIGRSTT